MCKHTPALCNGLHSTAEHSLESAGAARTYTSRCKPQTITRRNPAATWWQLVGQAPWGSQVKCDHTYDVALSAATAALLPSLPHRRTATQVPCCWLLDHTGWQTWWGSSCCRAWIHVPHRVVCQQQASVLPADYQHQDTRFRLRL